MITDLQILTIVLGAVPPTIVIALGILMNNSRLSDLRADMMNRFQQSDRELRELREEMRRRFDDVDRRFDESREIWRAELRRVEEVLDARLKHIEES